MHLKKKKSQITPEIAAEESKKGEAYIKRKKAMIGVFLKKHHEVQQIIGRTTKATTKG